MSRKTSQFRKMFRNKSGNKSRINRLRPLAGLLAAGLSLPGLAAAQSNYYPTYVTGPQQNGSWVVSDGQIINPAGTQVNLGIRVRAKAIALNPNAKTHTAAVLTLGTSTSDGNGAVEVFDTNTGIVLQNYIPFDVDPSGSYSGIAYSADGTHLVFSQDSSNVTLANVTPQGLAGRQHPGQRAAGQFLYQLLSEQPAGDRMADLAARSILRALLIPAALRSHRMARAPTPC